MSVFFASGEDGDEVEVSVLHADAEGEVLALAEHLGFIWMIFRDMVGGGGNMICSFLAELRSLFFVVLESRVVEDSG